MPMSPRLLRPRASGLVLPTDADARAYVIAVNTADGQPLEPLVVQAIDAFVIGCKSDGIWSAIKASCLLMGARTLSGALTPLVGSAPTNTNFVSGDYNRKTGLKGNATNKHIDTGRAGNADGQDSKHAAVYATEATSSTGALVFRVYYGNAPAGGNDHVLERPSSSNSTLTSRFHSSANDSLAGAGAATGFLGSSRSSSSSYVMRVSGSNTTITRTSGTPNANNYHIFTNNLTSSTLYADARIAFYSIGSSLDLALLDTRITTLYNAIGAAIP